MGFLVGLEQSILWVVGGIISLDLCPCSSSHSKPTVSVCPPPLSTPCPDIVDSNVNSDCEQGKIKALHLGGGGGEGGGKCFFR